MEDLTRFSSLLDGSDPSLGEALALIAAHDRAGVDADALLAELDAIADRSTARDAAALCSELFGPDGLHGDLDDYHDPRNSLLDQVLRRRLGIPITLSVIAIEIGRRRGIALVGIGLPGHFVVRDGLDPAAYFDPFRGGAPLDHVACRALFERLHGTSATFEESFLAPNSATQIISRVLANLRHSYTLRFDRAGLVRTLRLQSRLPEAGLLERRTLADLLAADGRFDEAADLHEQLLDVDPDPDQDHARKALLLRARMN